MRRRCRNGSRNREHGDTICDSSGRATETALEDAYLFGVRVRLVAAPGGEREAAALAATFGVSRHSAPSLEDVFVSLARQQSARAAEKVTS